MKTSLLTSLKIKVLNHFAGLSDDEVALYSKWLGRAMKIALGTSLFWGLMVLRS